MSTRGAGGLSTAYPHPYVLAIHNQDAPTLTVTLSPPNAIYRKGTMMLTLLMKLLPVWEGRELTAPRGDGGQCVDLAVLWCIALGLPRVWADASQWAKAYDSHHWQLIWNTPRNFPPPGALVLWHEYAPLDISTAGHIAICIQASEDHMVVLEQNWPAGSPCRIGHHGYGGVTGWLVPLPHQTR